MKSVTFALVTVAAGALVAVGVGERLFHSPSRSGASPPDTRPGASGGPRIDLGGSFGAGGPPVYSAGGLTAVQVAGQRFRVTADVGAGPGRAVVYTGAGTGISYSDPATGRCDVTLDVPRPGPLTATTPAGPVTLVLTNLPPTLAGVVAVWDPAGFHVLVTGTVGDEAPAGLTARVAPAGTGTPQETGIVLADGRFRAVITVGRKPAAVDVVVTDWYGLTAAVTVPVP